jgi:hypothetical protein
MNRSVIRGTRGPIRGLAKRVQAGEGLDILRQEYDYLDEDAFEFAVQWARANPRRGRPSRQRTPAPSQQPAGRRAHIERRQRATTAEA